MKRFSLDTVANVLLIVACLAVAASATAKTWVTARGPVPGAMAGYLPGERLPAIQGIDFRTHDKTLLLVLSSTCRYCTESMPFYKKLAAGAPRVQIVAVGSEPTERLTGYLSEHGLALANVSLPPGTLKVRGTPTLILVDRTGRVLHEWRGALRSRETEVEKALNE